jgi:N-methylhydantoinase B
MNPVTVEIVRNALIAAAEEMNTILIRSAFTPIIYEMKDCAVAILDSKHRILGQSSGLPIFLGNLEICSRYTEQRFGPQVWKPGDVWAINDTYVVGTHLNDVSIYAPVFFKGQVFGFAVSRAHWLEIGGKDMGNSMDTTSIYQEGLRLPPTRVAIGGELNRDVIDIIASNSRLPVGVVGDLHAQIAAAHVGVERTVEVLEKFGADTVRAVAEVIYSQTEELERAAIRAIPDGVYESHGYVDDDGLGNGPLDVRMNVRVSGSDIEVDLTDCSDQTPGPINSGEAQTISACRVGFKYLFASNIPVNGGSFRPLTVKTRPGSFLACTEPAPASWYFSSLGLQIDLLAKALAGAAPNIVAAADYGDSNPMIIVGKDPRNGKQFVDYECHVGGWGAYKGGDGVSVRINKVNCVLKDIPIEVCETRYPLRVQKYELREDSGGAGQWRGGCGIVREYEVLTDEANLALWWERSKTPGWGLFGGMDGAPPRVTVNPGRNNQRLLLKCNTYSLAYSDLIRCESGGGGGFGDPRKRERGAIQQDVLEGYVSRKEAAELYGYQAR